MERSELVRKLRSLRRLERRRSAGEAPIWERYFSLRQGERVRYPFGILRVLDRESRRRAFSEYLLEVWVASGAEPEADRELLEMLGLPPGAEPEEVRAAFRKLAREIHPDLGGDAELTRQLIERYRSSSYGGRNEV